MTRSCSLLIVLVVLLFGCRNSRSSGNYICVYEAEIPASKVSDSVVRQSDSSARLTVVLSEIAEYEEEDLTVGRLIHLDADTSYYQRLTDGKLTFEQSSGYYLFELKLFFNRIYRDSFQLNAFEHRKLTIDPGRPSAYVSYQTPISTGKPQKQKK